jgi:hypothetical protein
MHAPFALSPRSRELELDLEELRSLLEPQMCDLLVLPVAVADHLNICIAAKFALLSVDFTLNPSP